MLPWSAAVDGGETSTYNPTAEADVRTLAVETKKSCVVNSLALTSNYILKCC